MIRIIFNDYETQEFKNVTQALALVDTLDLSQIQGFEGDNPAVEKLAYYAGEKKFNRSNQDIKQLITSTKTLEQHYKDRGEYGKTINSTKHNLR